MNVSTQKKFRASLALAVAALSAILTLSSFSCATGAESADTHAVKGFPILVTEGTVTFHVQVYSKGPTPILRSEYTAIKKTGEKLTQTARKGSIIRVEVANLGRDLAEIETDGRRLIIGNARGSETKMTFIVE